MIPREEGPEEEAKNLRTVGVEEVATGQEASSQGKPLAGASLAVVHHIIQKGGNNQKERTPQEGFWPDPGRDSFMLAATGTQPRTND